MTGSEVNAPTIDREELFADRSLVGTVFCRSYARRADEWLQALFDIHIGKVRRGISLVATGGYGRSTLSPQSDLDVMLLHDGWSESQLEEAAQRLWFPVWDEKIALGHSVRTIDESIDLAGTDLDTATALLSLRHLAGDAELSDNLAEESTRTWRKNRRRWLPEIIENAVERERSLGEVAFLLEPDLKSARGGLRDVNAVDWVAASGVSVLDQEWRDLRASYDTLLAARVELHRSTSRKGDVLLLEEQDAVADALGIGDADLMMSQIAASARTITWIADDIFHRADRELRRFQWRRGRARGVADGVMLVGGTAAIATPEGVGGDPELMLRLAVAAAENDARIDRDSLDALVEYGPDIDAPWSASTRELFVRLLRTGDSAIPVIEALDHVDLFVRLLPEWEPNRSKVQRNQYHRFTVDRHLLEACAVASELTDRVDRPDLLVIGALLHDIGKGYPGDHTEVGVELIDVIARNMGFSSDDVATLKRLCEHHLLLPDAATRRDLEDPGTIQSVAEQVETPEFLHLLAALTEADSIATGPSAWSSWKAGLLADLVRRTDDWLAAGGAVEVDRTFPNSDQQRLLDAGERVVSGQGDSLTVVWPDRPGLFSRVAGALSLQYLSIIDAQIHAENGTALEVVRVVNAHDEDAPVDWVSTVKLVRELLTDDADLTPRFEARERSILHRSVQNPNPIEPVRVDFDNAVSAVATVIEVAGPDRVGLLHELSSALAVFGLDMRQARVQTVGGDVVDSFYVQRLDGSKLVDEASQAELRSILLDVLSPQGD